MRPFFKWLSSTTTTKKVITLITLDYLIRIFSFFENVTKKKKKKEKSGKCLRANELDGLMKKELKAFPFFDCDNLFTFLFFFYIQYFVSFCSFLFFRALNLSNKLLAKVLLLS